MFEIRSIRIFATTVARLSASVALLSYASVCSAGLFYEYTFEQQWGTPTPTINRSYGYGQDPVVANVQHYEQSIDGSANQVLWQISGTAQPPTRYTFNARSGGASLRMITAKGNPSWRFDQYRGVWADHSRDLNDRSKLNLQGGHSGLEKLFIQDKTYYTGFSLRIGPFAEHDTARDQWNVLLAWSNVSPGVIAPFFIALGRNADDWAPATQTYGGGVKLYAWANAFDFRQGRWDHRNPGLPIGGQMLNRGWWYDFVVMTRFGVGSVTKPSVKIWMKEAAQKWDANNDGVWEENERLAYVYTGNLGVIGGAGLNPSYKMVATIYRDRHTAGNARLPNFRDRRHAVYFDEIRIGDGNNNATPRQEVMPIPEVRERGTSW